LGSVRGGASQAAEQTRDIGGRGVDIDRAKVYQAGYFTAGEQYMIVPNVAEAGLQGQADAFKGFELPNGLRDNGRQVRKECPGQRR
jgi:hypothetical protein